MKKKLQKQLFQSNLFLLILLLWFLLTALSELEELNLDRTLITDEGCTVLSCKHHLVSSQIAS